MRLALGLVLLPVAGCHSALDLDIQYEDCVEVEQSNYLEEFAGTSTRPLRDSHCWKSDNEGVAPGGIDSKIFVEDGDLVMRVDDTQGATDLDEWTETEQAPMFFRRITGDFLVVVRAEASTIANADHCFLAKDVNRAGLVLRQSNDRSTWATWTVKPYFWTHSGTPSKPDCADDEVEDNNPTATVEVRASNPTLPTFIQDDVGADGEADLAICRVGSKVYYLYRHALDATTSEWLPKTDAVSHALGAGPLDVGLTVAGTAPSFEVAGHFNWIVYEQGLKGDGCAGALEEFTLPEDK